MSYDLKKALGTVSKSPQPFSIYEGTKGMTLVIPPIPKNITDVEAICGKGKVAVSGKCSKNDENAIVLKTKAPVQKKWTDGLKKAFAAAGCSSTHLEIVEDGEHESAENQGQESSGGTAPRPQTSPIRARSGAIGEKESSENENEEAPTGRARGGAVSGGTPPRPQTPPGTTWKPGTKPSADTPRGGESESNENQSQEDSKGTPQTPSRGGATGEKESSESESEEVPTGRARGGAVSERTPPETAWKPGTKPSADTTPGTTPKPPTPPPSRPLPPTPGTSASTPPTPPSQTWKGATPNKGGTATTPGAQAPKSTTPPTPPPTRPTTPSPKPPPSDQQLETEAQEHLTLRKGMKAVVTGVLQNYSGESAKMDGCIAKANEHTQVMRTKDRSDLGGLSESLGAVRNFLEQAETIVTEVQKDWDGRTVDGSDMMTARGDFSTLPKSWSEVQKKTYARESNEAFGAYDKVQRQVQKVLADMHAKIQEIKAIAEEAESLSGRGQDPQVYVERLTELNKQVDDSAKYFSLKLSKLEGSMARQKGWAESPTLTELEGKTIRQLYDLEIAAQDNVNSKVQQFDVAARRVSKIPSDARSNSGVAAALKKFNETAAKLSKDINSVKEKQNLSLKYLGDALKKVK